jgi:U4/U6.U5 tri-snRNP-associated protein 3
VTTRSTDAPPVASKVKKELASEDAMHIDSKTNGHKSGEEEEDSDDALLRKMMGFSTFKTTQNKKIPGNDVSGVRKEKSTNYRQYMNRTGGFNRPLSPSRD